MTATFKLDGVAVSATAWLARAFGEPGPTLAADASGSGAFGSIVIDDPGGTSTAQGWQLATLDEADCTAAPRLHTGYLYDRTYKRGSKYMTGAAREIDCTLLDPNAVLSLRLITGSDGKRPAETHIQRIDWLLGSTYLTGLITDLGLVDRSNPRPFEAADYRGQKPADVLADISAPIFRIFFAYYDQTAASVGLFFDTPTATTYNSTLTISNVATDVDNSTCFAPWDDAEFARTPEEVYSLVRYTYANGTVIVTNPTTASTYFSNGIVSRGLQINNSRVGLASTARAMGTTILTRDSAEHDTITCTVQLPSTHVGLIEAGMRLQVRFSHFPGFTSFTWTRVEHRSIQQRDRNNKLYEVTLQLSTKGLSGGGGGGAPGPGDFPHPPGTVSYVQEKGIENGTLVLDNDPTDGHLLTWYVTGRSVDVTGITPTGWTMLSHATNSSSGFNRRYGAVYYKIASGDDKTFIDFSAYTGIGQHMFEWADGVAIDTTVGTFGSISDQVAPGVLAISVTPTAVSTVVGCGLIGSDDSLPIFHTPGAGVTVLYDQTLAGFPPRTWVGIKTDQSGPSAVDVSFTGSNGWGGISYAVHSDASSNPPSPGQWVGIDPPEIVTMTGASGTTAFLFADGSLSVFVDNLDQTPSITSQNGATGAFTLGFTPKAGEVVTVRYQGR